MICRSWFRSCWSNWMLAVALLALNAGISSAATVAELAKASTTGSEDERLAAINELADLGVGAKAAVPQLTEALSAKEPKVRWHAARALGAIGPQAAAAVRPWPRRWKTKNSACERNPLMR